MKYVKFKFKDHQSTEKHIPEADLSELVMEARFDGNSELVAELVTVNGFKSAYAIKDGAEGPRGWMVFLVPSPFFLVYCLPYLYLKCFFLLIDTLTLIGILQSSGLPWTPPRKSLSLDLGNLTGSITGAIGVCIWDFFDFTIVIFNADAHTIYF